MRAASGPVWPFSDIGIEVIREAISPASHRSARALVTRHCSILMPAALMIFANFSMSDLIVAANSVELSPIGS